MTVLRESIRHHVLEEHSEMFPQCRRSSMELVVLRGELEARKAALESVEAAGAEATPSKEGPGLSRG